MGTSDMPAGEPNPKDAWVARVLQVQVGGVGDIAHATADAPAGPLLPLWVEAKDSVDAELSMLQQAMRGTRRSGLRQIAELGLAGLTDTQGVGMMVALRNLDADPGSAAARRKAAAATAAFRKFLSANKMVDLVERNPFGVKQNMRATFGRALDTIDRRIAQ